MKINDSLILDSAIELTREQEIELVKRFQVAALEMEKEKTPEVVERYRSASSDIIKSQIAWIYNRINKYHRSHKHVDFEDLASELIMVILQTLRKESFDTERTALTTYVDIIVRRRVGRIAKRLAGLKTQDVVDSLTDIPEAQQADDRMDELIDAIAVSGISPIARMAIDLHLNGIKDDAIADRLAVAFPTSEKRNVKAIIENALDAIRSTAKELGYDPVEVKRSQGQLF